METEKPSEPDSTTLEKDVRQQFRKDEDVLCLNSKDGCFYLGTIVQVDNIYKKCLVEFLDNTKMWSSFKDLKSFAPQEPEICYVCKKSQLKDENNIIICKCGRECQQDGHELRIVTVSSDVRYRKERNRTTVASREKAKTEDEFCELLEFRSRSNWSFYDQKVISSTEYYGRGLVKRSTPFPVSDQASNVDTRFRSHAVRKARRLLNKNLKRKKTASTSVLRSRANVVESHDRKSSRVSHKRFSQSFEEFVQLRKKKIGLESRPTNPEIRKRPQRNLLEARLNSTESKLYNPFTPVDISESRRSRNVVHENSKKSDSSSRKSKSNKTKTYEKHKTVKPKLIQKTLFDSFNLKNSDKQKYELIPLVSKCKTKESDQTSGDSKSNSVKSGRGRRSVRSERSESLDRTPVESDLVDSSDDEASSRGTLEPFIPTPKDFEGQNHPFRSVTHLMSFSSAAVPSNPPITLPLPLKTVITHTDPPRLKKRQLSEDDIIIDRNGQVKRRRRHRKMGSGTAAKSAQITPGKSKKHWGMRNEKKMLQPLINNGGDFALNGRQLRAREPVKMTDKQAPAAKTSPLKQSPTKDGGPLSEDLESSVKYFFGAASRILNGEKYEVRAKRITFDGRLQCIIDWKGLPT